MLVPFAEATRSAGRYCSLRGGCDALPAVPCTLQIGPWRRANSAILVPGDPARVAPRLRDPVRGLLAVLPSGGGGGGDGRHPRPTAFSRHRAVLRHTDCLPFLGVDLPWLAGGQRRSRAVSALRPAEPDLAVVGVTGAERPS